LNYIPVVAFLVAVVWMIWQGFIAKREYLHVRKLQEEFKRRSIDGSNFPTAQKTGQGQTPEPTQLFGTRQKEPVAYRQ